MKIGVVGCGAPGSYYGGLLCRDGHDTHFLLRSDFQQVKEHGVHIESPNGDFTVHPHAHQNPSAIGSCDLVLIGLKTTANDQFPKLIPPLVGPDTSKLSDLPIEQCLDANSLLSDPKWESRVRQLMNEVRSAAGKIGYEIDAGLAGQLITRTRTMGPYKASTLIDYEKGYPLEMDSLFREPLRQAREASSSTTLLDRLVLILEELQGRQDKRDLST